MIVAETVHVNLKNDEEHVQKLSLLLFLFWPAVVITKGHLFFKVCPCFHATCFFSEC